jgi:hypothetical protein
MIDVLRPMMQLSPMLTSVGCISSMYTNWLIQTFLPIATPRRRCSHGRKLNPPGAIKAILPASLLSRTGSLNGSTSLFRIRMPGIRQDVILPSRVNRWRSPPRSDRILCFIAEQIPLARSFRSKSPGHRDAGVSQSLDSFRYCRPHLQYALVWFLGRLNAR